jgi:hypothetical protein
MEKYGKKEEEETGEELKYKINDTPLILTI